MWCFIKINVSLRSFKFSNVFRLALFYDLKTEKEKVFVERPLATKAVVKAVGPGRETIFKCS